MYFGSDLLVTGFLDPDQVVEWAEFRSVIGLAGLFCLVGLDQVLIRSPQSSARILSVLAFQVPLLAVPVSIVLAKLEFVRSPSVAFLLALGSAGTIALFHYYRTNRLMIMAQLAQQGWVVVAFFAIVAYVVRDLKAPMMPLLVTIVILCAVCFALALFIYRPSRTFRQEPEPLRNLYAVGTRFMVTSVFLALSMYAEQLLIQTVGTTEEAASYFTHSTYFLYPVNVINGYLGFVLGPWVRDRHDELLGIVRRHRNRVLGAVLGVAITLHFVGMVGWGVLSPAVGEPDVVLRAIFLMMSVIMLLYNFTSAYNGVLAQPSQHDILITGQVAAFGVAVAIFALVWRVMDGHPLYAVALGSLTNWTLRTGLGLCVVRIVAQRRSYA